MTPKQLWAAALRSGAYVQGVSYLRAARPDGPDRWCCMGVLCELFRQETGRGTWITPPYSDTLVFEVDTNRGESYPPNPVRDWAGLTHAEEDDLVQLNDVIKTNFDNIAAVVLGQAKESDFRVQPPTDDGRSSLPGGGFV